MSSKECMKNCPFSYAKISGLNLRKYLTIEHDCNPRSSKDKRFRDLRSRLICFNILKTVLPSSFVFEKDFFRLFVFFLKYSLDSVLECILDSFCV